MKLFDKEKIRQRKADRKARKEEKKRIRREKKEARKLEKERKKLKKKFHKTVDWIDIDYVADNYISLGGEQKVLFGFKLIPPKLALENDDARMLSLSHLVLALNSCDLEIHNDTILSPIDVSVDIMHLNEQAKRIEDEQIRSICYDEIELLQEQSLNMRSEYFFTHRCAMSDTRSLQKFDEFFRRFSSEGFIVEELNHQDLMNYIAYKFKNEYIYDFYFPRAAFEKLPAIERRLDKEGDTNGPI